MTTKRAPDDEPLGPIGPVPSEWERDARTIIVSAFRAAARQVAEAASLASTDLATSVHEFRKALRRARATLALIRPVIGGEEFAAIRNELRTARRAVSAARDYTVALASLGALPLDPREREVAEVLLAILREHGPVTEEISAQMADGAQRAAQQASALDAALPTTVEWGTIAKGFARTYRQARNARKSAKRSRRAFHRWRRRTKEIDAQLTLVAAHGGTHTHALHAAYEEISNLLGPIADLLMLSELIEAHGKASDRDRFEVLAAGINRLAREQIRTARTAAKPLFRRSSSEMAKKVTKALHKDATPSAPRMEGDDPGDSDD
jgi:CHAD domain-containing protein